MSASHGSHDMSMSPTLDSRGSDSHARPGSSKQHGANLGSTVHEQGTAYAKASAEVSRSTAQAPDAEELFASWHGRPTPTPAPPVPKQQPQAHRRRSAAAVFFILHCILSPAPAPPLCLYRAAMLKNSKVYLSISLCQEYHVHVCGYTFRCQAMAVTN